MLLPHAVIFAALTAFRATSYALAPLSLLEAVQLLPACIPAQTPLHSSRLARGVFPASVLARAGVCLGALAAELRHRTFSRAESREKQTDAALFRTGNRRPAGHSAMFRLFITERKGNIHWNVPSRVEASKAALKQLPACHATRGKTEEPYDPQRTTT